MPVVKIHIEKLIKQADQRKQSSLSNLYDEK